LLWLWLGPAFVSSVAACLAFSLLHTSGVKRELTASSQRLE
jgi:hypothetical protein